MLVDNQDCDFDNGIMLDETGSFQWVAEPGTYIFACTRVGWPMGDHCASGKQQVTVIVQDTGGSVEAPVCEGDVDGDMMVNISDLLALLGQFGRAGDAITIVDVVPDFVIDINDLLMLLSQFGGSC